MADRLALLGGSFDPIHLGHLIAARSVVEQLSLSRAVLIPSPRPPHKTPTTMTDARHRLEMARLAVEGDPLFEVSDVELRRPGPSYTIDTVAAFRRERGREVELFWIIGADSLPELPSWYRVAELVRMVRIVTATRPGWVAPATDRLAAALGRAEAEVVLGSCMPTPAIEISSTDIRRRVRSGQSIRYLVAEPVASYIHQNRLYCDEGSAE